MAESFVRETFHYIPRSSTEFFLSGRYRSELYLTPIRLSDSDFDDIDDDFLCDRDFETNPEQGLKVSLELQPNEIESRIEDFLNKFKYSGCGNLQTDNYSFDCPSQDVPKGSKCHFDEDKSSKKVGSKFTGKFIKLENLQGLRSRKGKAQTYCEGMDLDNIKTSEDSFDLPSKSDKSSKAPVDKTNTSKFTDKNLNVEHCMESCNFRVSWISNESSTPSGPRQSITSPSDNNFISSSLASSVMSQMEDEIANESWLINFSTDSFNYPDCHSNPTPLEGNQGNQGCSVSPCHSRKFSNSSFSTSIIRALPRSSTRFSIASAGSLTK